MESCAQMREALLARFGRASITIMTAAVSDFAPAEVAEQKIKRDGALKLDLQPTADILAELGSSARPGQLLIGFAAETQNLVENARGKLERKHLDAIVLNDVSRPGLGFGSERNAGEIITADESDGDSGDEQAGDGRAHPGCGGEVARPAADSEGDRISMAKVWTSRAGRPLRPPFAIIASLESTISIGARCQRA